jgi:hypothetical protein
MRIRRGRGCGQWEGDLYMHAGASLYLYLGCFSVSHFRASTHDGHTKGYAVPSGAMLANGQLHMDAPRLDDNNINYYYCYYYFFIIIFNINIIFTVLKSHTMCISRAHTIRLYVPSNMKQACRNKSLAYNYK